MPRSVHPHALFTRDLAAQVGWLRTHRPAPERERLRDALARFCVRVAARPALGLQVQLRGSLSIRVFTIGSGLPYLIWYRYDSDPQSAIQLLMLRHESQDHARFTPEEFD